MYVTLLNGDTVDSKDVSFDPGSYHFTANGNDITDQLYQADKRVLGGSAYDVTKDDIRLSNEAHPGLNQAGSTSTVDNFLGNMDSSISSIGTTISGIGTSSTATLTPIAIILVAAVVLIVLVKD